MGREEKRNSTRSTSAHLEYELWVIKSHFSAIFNSKGNIFSRIWGRIKSQIYTVTLLFARFLAVWIAPQNGILKVSKWKGIQLDGGWSVRAAFESQNNFFTFPSAISSLLLILLSSLSTSPPEKRKKKAIIMSYPQDVGDDSSPLPTCV